MAVAAAQLVCRRRSRQPLGAGADDPHTNRKITRRPFSRCGTRRPTLEITYCSSSRVGGCGCGCSPACPLTSPTSASMSSELARARWTATELFMIDRHPHLPAAIMLHVLDQPCLRHLCAALGRCRVSSRRAAAAVRRSARLSHTMRSNLGARTSVTVGASDTATRRAGTRRHDGAFFRPLPC